MDPPDRNLWKRRLIRYITKAGSGKTDADSQGLIHGAYQAGLDNVKKMAEGK